MQSRLGCFVDHMLLKLNCEVVCQAASLQRLPSVHRDAPKARRELMQQPQHPGCHGGSDHRPMRGRAGVDIALPPSLPPLMPAAAQRAAAFLAARQ